MPPEALAAATARRHELTRAKAIQALRELARAGAPVTFASVAATAGISRSWLYTQPDLRGQIQELRAAAAPPGPTPPARQRASDPSLRARLTVALDRNRQLAEKTPVCGGNSPGPSATSCQHGSNPVTINPAEKDTTTPRTSRPGQ